MKRNKPTSHRPPRITPYGKRNSWDGREIDKSVERLDQKRIVVAELDEIAVDKEEVM